MPPFVIATVPRLALREPPPGEVKPGVQWAVLIPRVTRLLSMSLMIGNDDVAVDLALTLTPTSSDNGRTGAGASA